MGWYRVKFPRNIIQLCHHARTSHQQRHNKFIFRIPPHMGKTELKNILTSLYDLQVKKINTANYDGAFCAGRRRAGLQQWSYESRRSQPAPPPSAAARRRTPARPGMWAVVRPCARSPSLARSPLVRLLSFVLSSRPLSLAAACCFRLRRLDQAIGRERLQGQGLQARGSHAHPEV